MIVKSQVTLWLGSPKGLREKSMRTDPGPAEAVDGSLINLRPTRHQRWIALAVTVALLTGLAVSAPFADVALPPINQFIPVFETAVILTDLITAVLLFSQSRIYRSRAVLALAGGYLFTSLIVIPHALTFPGAFSATGLLGAGPQTTGWLYVFWHLGPPMAILIYACLRGEQLSAPSKKRQPIGWTVAGTIIAACGLAWLAIAGEPTLPRLFLDRTHIAPFGHYIVGLEALICAIALAVLWCQQRSVLDLWLMVIVLALGSELIINGLFITDRFTLGWYVSRIFSLITSTLLLIVLLDESMRLYGRIARSNAMLLREQNNRLMNLEALAGSIRHEIVQPLTGITTRSAALLRLLEGAPLQLEKIRSIAEEMVAAAHGIGQIMENLRNLFGRAERAETLVDINEVGIAALTRLDTELKERKITIRSDLDTNLPAIVGHKGQLEEVFVNLIQNAIDAMATLEHGPRILKVKTQRNSGDAVTAEIEDTGPGIMDQNSADIFDAFFTTKPHGTGLGLAICRMIVERHGGQLSTSPARPHGAIFQIALPPRGANLR